jgi:outer membrane protein assembly factor BamB
MRLRRGFLLLFTVALLLPVAVAYKQAMKEQSGSPAAFEPHLARYLQSAPTTASLSSSPTIPSLLVGPDGTLYAPSGGDYNELYALDPSDGSPRWVWSVPGGGLALSPLFLTEAKLLVAVSKDGTLTAVTTDLGQVLWSITLPAVPTSAPLLSPAGDALIVSVTPRIASVYKVGLKDGDVVWEASGVEGSPLLDPRGDRLYVSHGGALLAALDGDTGKATWVARIPSPLLEPGSLELAKGGEVLFAQTDLSVFGLDTQTGKLRWVYLVRPPGRRLDATTASRAMSRRHNDD